jgi:two-component system cell cycle sensor histidine kinase/response regulator CckA
LDDGFIERGATEEALERARRTLLVLTRCNEAILRATSEQELFGEVCRVIVETGGYRMCWVGVAENDARRTIRPVAHAGHEAGYLATIDVVWADEPLGRGPTGTAAREGRVVVGRDFASEPMLAPWRQEALRRGYTSSTALPIAYGAERVGVLTMYSGDVRVFTDEELRLVKRLAEDLGFGAVALRRRGEKERVERELRENQQSLRALFDLSPDATVISRARDGVVVDVNDSFLSLTGWSREEAVGRSAFDLGIWADPADHERVIGRLEKDGVVRNAEVRVRTRSGVLLDVLLSARVLVFGGEPVLLTLVRDMTEANKSARRYRLLADNSLDVIWTLDLESLRLNYVSPAIERLRGLTVKEALAEPFEESMTPESLARVATMVSGKEAAAPDGGANAGIIDQPCADGSVKHVEIRTSYVRNEEGRPVEILGVSRDATARVDAERALERRERELRTILQTAIDGFASLNGRGVIAEVNEAFCAITGYSRQELLGMHISGLDRVESDAQVAARMASIRASGADRFETRYRRKDGALIDVELSVRYSADVEERYHAFLRDVTDRKHAEAELRESSQRVATLVRVARVGFLVTRVSDRTIVDANEAWCALVGWSREEVLGRTTTDLGLFQPGDARRERVYAPLEGQSAFRVEDVGLRRRSGEEASVLITGDCAEIGGERCVIAAWHDLTALRRADAALRENEARFRTLIERSSDLIVLLDAGGRTTFWSPSASESLGWTPDEAIGGAFLEHVAPEEADGLSDALGRLLAAPAGTERVAFRIRCKDGTWRSMEGLCRNLLPDPAVRALVMNLRDVTEHLQLEEQFRQAQRLESIGRLAGGVAHDFNNLLTVILSCSESMQEARAAGKPVGDDEIWEIHQAGMRARDLTRQLLAFARKQVIAPVSLDLNDVVRGSEKLLLRLLGEDVRLEVALAAELWPTLCDASQVEQVLVNLAVNARDAMPGGGWLRIETSNVNADHDEMGMEAGRPPGDWVRIVVRDSGMGMPPEVMAHLFEPFFTTKERGRGTGLGLATVHGIVAQSGGHIHVESEPGRGTSFGICLPRSEEEPVERPATPRPGTLRGSETLLVVEDDPRVRSITVRALQAHGYRVITAGSGEDAVAAAGGTDGQIDLVVTDVVMPGMSGREVVDALRLHRPGLRALFVSGYTQDAIAQRGVLDSGVEFLPKPFTPATLAARVREVLDARPPSG